VINFVTLYNQAWQGDAASIERWLVELRAKPVVSHDRLVDIWICEHALFIARTLEAQRQFLALFDGSGR
jgi:hypothetical protein